MFKLARCNQFMELKKKYINYFNNDSIHTWSLKQFGKLFILDQIMNRNPQRVLEVGGGLDTFFAHQFGSKLEYWMVDNGDLYPDPTEFREKMAAWTTIHFVDSLMGNFSLDLHDNYFDMLFSISVLEHTPRDKVGLVEKICSDMYRVIKPGGYACHTIDIVPVDNIAYQYLEALLAKGFLLCGEVQSLNWNVSDSDNQILLENLKIVYENYYRAWREAGKPIEHYHFGSVTLMLQKPTKLTEKIPHSEEETRKRIAKRFVNKLMLQKPTKLTEKILRFVEDTRKRIAKRFVNN